HAAAGLLREQLEALLVHLAGRAVAVPAVQDNRRVRGAGDRLRHVRGRLPLRQLLVARQESEGAQRGARERRALGLVDLAVGAATLRQGLERRRVAGLELGAVDVLG